LCRRGASFECDGAMKKSARERLIVVASHRHESQHCIWSPQTLVEADRRFRRGHRSVEQARVTADVAVVKRVTQRQLRIRLPEGRVQRNRLNEVALCFDASAVVGTMSQVKPLQVRFECRRVRGAPHFHAPPVVAGDCHSQFSGGTRRDLAGQLQHVSQIALVGANPQAMIAVGVDKCERHPDARCGSGHRALEERVDAAKLPRDLLRR
jgi:hypothetical protein